MAHHGARSVARPPKPLDKVIPSCLQGVEKEAVAELGPWNDVLHVLVDGHGSLDEYDGSGLCQYHSAHDDEDRSGRGEFTPASESLLWNVICKVIKSGKLHLLWRYPRNGSLPELWIFTQGRSSALESANVR